MPHEKLIAETGNDALTGYNAISYGVRAYDNVSTGTGLISSDYVAAGEGVTAVVGVSASVNIATELYMSRGGAFVKPTKKADFV